MTNISDHGGERVGAGRKKGQKRSQSQRDYSKAKARLEGIKADRAALALRGELSNVVSRSALAQAIETTIAAFTDCASKMRESLPKIDGAARAAAQIDAAIVAALATLADDLRQRLLS